MQMSKLVLPARSVADKISKREDVLFFSGVLQAIWRDFSTFKQFTMGNKMSKKAEEKKGILFETNNVIGTGKTGGVGVRTRQKSSMKS